MSSNFFSIDLLKQTDLNEINIYKDTIYKLSKIKKNINQLKKITNNNNQNDIDLFKEKVKLKNLEDSYEDSLILLNVMKQEIEKIILKKYNIEEINHIKKYNNINKSDIIEDLETSYENIINNNNKDINNILIKKNS